jgi:ectoine hydroxylase
MELDRSDIAEFDDQGYLFIPGLFTTEEIEVLCRDLPNMLSQHGPEVIREPDHESAIRLVYGGHENYESFKQLSRHPRLLRPVSQLVRDEVYIHQSRLNPKPGFGKGGSWTWHQDYGTWHRVDGMQHPKAVMTAVFLDDCTAVNAPLMVVPGSQNHGLIQDVAEDDQAKGYALYDIDRDTLQTLADEHGIEALMGPAGSVCFLHCNIVHGSSNNVSPWDRTIMYMNYNAVSNACTGTDRSWYHNNRNFTPLIPLEDDCLLR